MKLKAQKEKALVQCPFLFNSKASSRIFMSTYSVLKNLETQTASINLCDNGLIRVMLKKNSEIDKEKAQENIKAYIELIDENLYSFLIFPEDDSIVYMEDARRDAKKNEVAFDKICVAVVIKNLAQKLLANFYLKFHQPGYPFKVFSSTETAEAWCISLYKIYQETNRKDKDPYFESNTI